MPFRTLAKFGKVKPSSNTNGEFIEAPKKEKNIDSSIVLDTIKKRRSVRAYTDASVSAGIIKRLIESASYAPSAGNTQPWEFIVVRDPEQKKNIGGCVYGQNWIETAPVIIVACINMRLAKAVYRERGERLYGIQAVAAAVENLMIAAESLGLGTCWIGSFNETKLSVLLDCPTYVRPSVIVTLGWPAEKPRMPHRQDMKEIYHEEKFGQSLFDQQTFDAKTRTFP